MEENRLTIMWLTITFTFLALIGWQCITQYLYEQNFQADDPYLWRYVTNSFYLGKTAIAINCSMNFVFYCLSATNFCDELTHTFSFTKDHRAKVYSVRLARGSSPPLEGCNENTTVKSERTTRVSFTNKSSVMNPSDVL